jgi:hypothetical protein
MAFLLTHGIPTGPVCLTGDDTVAEHPGPRSLVKAGIVMAYGPLTTTPLIAGAIHGW